MINVPNHIDSLEILNKRIKHLEEIGRITSEELASLKAKIEKIKSIRIPTVKPQNSRQD
jgi:chaperonin cofactor prefoldin